MMEAVTALFSQSNYKVTSSAQQGQVYWGGSGKNLITFKSTLAGNCTEILLWSTVADCSRPYSYDFNLQNVKICFFNVMQKFVGVTFTVRLSVRLVIVEKKPNTLRRHCLASLNYIQLIAYSDPCFYYLCSISLSLLTIVILVIVMLFQCLEVLLKHTSHCFVNPQIYSETHIYRTEKLQILQASNTSLFTSSEIYLKDTFNTCIDVFHSVSCVVNTKS